MYPIGYNISMYTIEETETFSKWLSKLRDLKGKIAVARRIERMRSGSFGDVKPVGENVSELRVDTGPGYRVYYTVRGSEIVILLIGGDKSTQQRDIEKAKSMAKEFQ